MSKTLPFICPRHLQCKFKKHVKLLCCLVERETACSLVFADLSQTMHYILAEVGLCTQLQSPQNYGMYTAAR